MTKWCVHEILGVFADKCLYCEMKKLGVKESDMLKLVHDYFISLNRSYSGHGCDRCGKPDQPYSLVDSMWKAATDNTHEAYLCLECVKLRVGGKLRLKHFTKAPISYGVFIFDIRAYLKHSK